MMRDDIRLASTKGRVHSDNENITGVRSKIIKWATAKNDRPKSAPLWLQYREKLKSALAEFHKNSLEKVGNPNPSVIETYQSVEKILSDTLNPALLRLLVLQSLMRLQTKHSFLSRLWWRLEYQLIESLRKVVDRVEYNEMALYYAYTAMMESLIQQKFSDIKHLEEEIQTHKNGSRAEQITRDYYALLEERRKLKLHVENLSDELDDLKEENGNFSSKLQNAEVFSKEAFTIIQNMRAEIEEYRRSNEGLEKELNRVYQENAELLSALQELNQKNVELKQENTSLKETVSSQKTKIKALSLEKSQIEARARKGVYESKEYRQLEKEKDTLVKVNQQQSAKIGALNEQVKSLDEIRQQNIQQIECLKSILGNYNDYGLFKNIGFGKIVQSKLREMLDKLNPNKDEDEDDHDKNSRGFRLNG